MTPPATLLNMALRWSWDRSTRSRYGQQTTLKFCTLSLALCQIDELETHSMYYILQAGLCLLYSSYSGTES
jgi:hypothetical protein